MAKNDEGEFELVLGNRQLLSGFFIVVILFGLFFTMGYIVGRHSSPAPLNASAAPASQEPASSGTVAPESPAPAAAPAPGQAEVIVEARPPEMRQTEGGTKPATAPAEAPRPAERKPPEVRAPVSDVAEPAPGTYLQVAAPKRTAAGGIVDSLKNKSITAVLAPGPNEETVRILVGPLDAASLGKTRSDLESAGFKPFLKKY
jgi:hypothetical protein